MLSSSLITFFSGLIAILSWKLLHHFYQTSGRRRLPPLAKETDQGIPGYYSRTQVGVMTRLKWYAEECISGQTVPGRIFVSEKPFQKRYKNIAILKLFALAAPKVLFLQLSTVTTISSKWCVYFNAGRFFKDMIKLQLGGRNIFPGKTRETSRVTGNGMCIYPSFNPFLSRSRERNVSN